MKGLSKMQIGKKGLTESLLDSLKKAFNTRKRVDIKVLKSIADKEKVKEIEERLREELGKKFKFKVIGHTIKIRKG
jgi:RNA-binding protein YhbY